MSRSSRKAVADPAGRPAKVQEPTEAPRPDGGVVITVNGVRVEVPPELEAAVQRAYKGLFSPLPREMTTTQAAGFLDVSRPFVIKLVKQGELPCRLVGKHRRIPSAALQKYREKMFRRAKNAADEMAQRSQDLGLYELEGPPPKGS